MFLATSRFYLKCIGEENHYYFHSKTAGLGNGDVVLVAEILEIQQHFSADARKLLPKLVQ